MIWMLWKGAFSVTDDELRKIYYPIAEAWKLIRAQGEQIRRMSAEEYLKDKIGSDADE